MYEVLGGPRPRPDPATGERRRTRHGGFPTKRDAERARVRLLAELDQGGYAEPATVTVGTFVLERSLPAMAVRLRANTLAMYRQNIGAHIVPRLGFTPLQRLTPPYLNAFCAELLAGGREDVRGGLSERTVRIQHVILRRALSDAVRWGLLARNPAEYADPPPGRSAEAAVWSAQQVRQFLDHQADDRLLGLWRLAAATGMRRSELARLRWDDIDLGRGDCHGPTGRRRGRRPCRHGAEHGRRARGRWRSTPGRSQH